MPSVLKSTLAIWILSCEKCGLQKFRKKIEKRNKKKQKSNEDVKMTILNIFYHPIVC